MLKPNRGTILIFLGPAVIFYMLVFLYPTLRTTAMSFFAVVSVSDSISTWSFNGISNYFTIFKSQLFVQSMFNFARLLFVGGIVVLLIALLFAVILAAKGMRGVKFYRSVMYLPYTVSAVAMGTMWLNYVYNPEYGLLHNVLAFLGFQAASQTLWTGPGLRFWSMLAAYSFGMVGYHMLIFMSGIEQIPQDYHDCAMIEGANVFQRFRHITMPFIRGVTRTNIVMWTVFTVAFFIWGMVFSPVNVTNDTTLPMNYMYQAVFGAQSAANIIRDSGAGAAVGVIMMLTVVIVFFSTSLITRNDDTEL